MIEDKKKINSDIAIIGLATRMPDADTAADFWRNLKAGRCHIGDLPPERKRDVDRYLEFSGQEKFKSRYLRRAFLHEIDKFDYAFFGITEAEAKLIDPCQRILLEVVWQALENSGYPTADLYGTDTGVFIGHYNDLKYKKYADLIEDVDISLAPKAISGNMSSIIGGRISYFFNFHGPCFSIDTACSSSLVALHLACEEIRKKNCCLAIAGAINIDPVPVDRNNKILIDSPYDRTLSFDNSADGTAWGEGVVAVVLKSLEQALRDRDNIWAVIKGSGINHDGRSISLTAPDPSAQASLIKEVVLKSQINPETISYVEAHGTATSLGDPIEIDGLRRAFKEFTDKKQFCALGSVKANIGHLENVAGLAGFLKIILALKNKQIPALVNFKTPNHLIDFEDSPVFVNDRLIDWPIVLGAPRRAGLSSFGFSGTNCHMIIEEAPIIEDTAKGESDLFVLSAKTKEALVNLIKDYDLFFEDNPDLALADICFTARQGRNHFPERLAIVVNNFSELKEKVRQLARLEKNQEEIIKEKLLIQPGKIDFRKKILIEAAAAYLADEKKDWPEILLSSGRKINLPGYRFARTRVWLDFPEIKNSSNVYAILNKKEKENEELIVYSARFNQKEDWFVSGHKARDQHLLVGTTYLEMVVEAFKDFFPDSQFRFEDVVYFQPLIFSDNESRELKLVLRKNKDGFNFEIRDFFDQEHNSQKDRENNIYASGKISPLAMEEFLNENIEDIKKNSIKKYGRDELHKIMAVVTNYEFGERWKNIDNIYVVKSAREWLIRINLQEKYGAELKKYILHPALFDNLFPTEILAAPDEIFLPFSYREIKIYRPLEKEMYSHVSLNKLADGILDINVSLLDKGGRQIAAVKNYLYKKTDSFNKKNYFYETVWQKTEGALTKKESLLGSILVFNSRGQRAEEILNELRKQAPGRKIIEVVVGKEYEKISSEKFTINLKKRDYDNLFTDLSVEPISRIIHLFSLQDDQKISSLAELLEIEARGVMSLFYAAQAIQEKLESREMDIVLISNFVSLVSDRQTQINYAAAPLFGLGKTISMENPNLSCRTIDIDDVTDASKIVEEILNKTTNDYKIAYRQDIRYGEFLRKLNFNFLPDKSMEVKNDGVYLIAGGLGGVGLNIAQYFSRQAKIKLVFVNRTKFPHRAVWPEILSAGSNKKVIGQIEKILEIEKNGSSVHLISADISLPEENERMMVEIKRLYGTINGIVQSAGIAGDGFIINKAPAVFQEVLAAKIRGTWLLHHFTKNSKLDFFILFSSVASLFGSPGQGDYIAANSFLDSFVYYLRAQKIRALVINWASWRDSGMAFDLKTKYDLVETLTTREAFRSFAKISRKDVAHVMIGELNARSAIWSEGDRYIKIRLSPEILEDLKKNNQNFFNVKIERIVRVKGVSDITELQKSVAQIWGNALGYDEVSLADNFFELGGDSLTALKFLGLINKKHNTQISITDLFKNSTFGALADDLEKNIKNSNN